MDRFFSHKCCSAWIESRHTEDFREFKLWYNRVSSVQTPTPKGPMTIIIFDTFKDLEPLNVGKRWFKKV